MTKWITYVALLICLGVALGCAPAGPERYQVRGFVTLNGKPVPAGEIIFEPDPKKGNVGPQSRNEIKDGNFETQAGKGVVPGGVIATIKPHNGKPHPENKFGLPTHPTVQIFFEMPRADLERNFEVTEGETY